MYQTPNFHTRNIDELVSLLNSIFNTSHDGLFVSDKNGYSLLYNEAFLQITGLPQGLLNTNTIYQLLEKGYLPNACTPMAIKTKKTHSTMINYYNGKKTVVTSTPFCNENQEILFVVTNIRDVTEINNLQHELDEMRQVTSTYQKVINRLQEGIDTNQTVIYRSETMSKIISMATRYSKNDSSILLLGESGVGKDVLAEYIHNNSGRKGNFIKINCGAIPEHLVESELFGYEKGAYTGANKAKEGLFELAHEGTVFLDEIGDLPYLIQVKLLNVLQDSLIRRVGGTEMRQLSIRVIAATNSDLAALVEQKKFRQDLYYRLNVLSLTIPPLRERPEDISILLYYYLKKLEQKYNIKKRLDHEVLEKCLNYDWPGNVRELKNIVERLFHMSENNEITLDILPSSILSSSKVPIKNIDIDTNQATELKDVVSAFEKAYISEILSQTSNMQECANKLGINISTLVRKKQKLKID